MECFVFDQLVKRIETLEREVEQLKNEYNPSSWLDLEELCKRYPIPIHLVKSRQWRLENSFPTYQVGPYCRVFFYATEVEEWLKENYKNG